MKKALLFAPMGSVHRRFNKANIDALISLDYEIHLLANFNNGDGPEKNNQNYLNSLDERIVIHSLPFVRHSLLRNIKLVSRIKRILREERFEIIHVHTETGGLLLRLCANCIDKATKLIYTPHGMSFYKGSSLKSQLIYKPIEKWICKKMDFNLAMNSEEYYYIKKWKKTSVYYVHGVGLDLSRFKNLNYNHDYLYKEFKIPIDSKIVLSVGELDDNKNHKIIIEALSKIDRNDIYYLICGVGPNKESLINFANDKGFSDRLILAGFRNDIPQILSSVDVFAFPSYHEGLAVSLMEAMAARVPVVCSKIRGNVDLIEDNVNGFTCKVDDFNIYKEAIEVILNDNQLAKKFVEESRNKIINYSFENVKRELLDVYAK